MLSPLLHTSSLNTGFAKRLLASLPDDRMVVLPTVGDCFVCVMASHDNMHCGQRSAWRWLQNVGRV
jgi:hypothetical protein